MTSSMRRCNGCGIKCVGELCQTCRYDAMRKPLHPCVDCQVPLHRRKTRTEDRLPGSRPLDSHERCAPCVKKAVKAGAIVRGPKEQSPSTGRPAFARRPPTAVLTVDEQAKALCSQADPEIFFPEVGAFTESRAARKVCAQCPIRARCLEVALENNEEYGIFGGLTSHERKDLRRVRKTEAEPVTLGEFWAQGVA